MNLRFIEWIWHIKGSVPLAAGQSDNETFGRLDPLFGQTGTSHERIDHTLVFRKKDQAAQDKMSVFDSGILKIEKSVDGSVLHYHLISKILLFCFLAPFMFLGVAQGTIAIGNLQATSTEAGKSGKASDELKKSVKKLTDVPMNPIDKALGAPAPEKPGKDADAAEKPDKKPSPTPAYVFAAIFATLYVVGRILEARLAKALFTKTVAG